MVNGVDRLIGLANLKVEVSSARSSSVSHKSNDLTLVHLLPVFHSKAVEVGVIGFPLSVFTFDNNKFAVAPEAQSVSSNMYNSSTVSGIDRSIFSVGDIDSMVEVLFSPAARVFNFTALGLFIASGDRPSKDGPNELRACLANHRRVMSGSLFIGGFVHRGTGCKEEQ